MRGARDNPRLRHVAQQIHDLGARPLFELLAELVDGGGEQVLDRLERYASLPADFIADYGGRNLPGLQVLSC